jgi:hypothetical protein
MSVLIYFLFLSILALVRLCFVLLDKLSLSSSSLPFFLFCFASFKLFLFEPLDVGDWLPSCLQKVKYQLSGAFSEALQLKLAH